MCYGNTVRFTATVRKDGSWYVAQCVEVDVLSQGESVESAVDNLREALELYFEDRREIDLPFGSTIVATVDVSLPINARR